MSHVSSFPEKMTYVTNTVIADPDNITLQITFFHFL